MKESRMIKWSLFFISLCTVTAALVYTKSVLLPFVISLFVYAIISPAIEFFEVRFKVPRFLSVALTITILLLVFIILVTISSLSVQHFLVESVLYKQKLIDFGVSAAKGLENFGVELNRKFIEDRLLNLPVFEVIKKISGGLFSVVGDSVLIFIFTSFLLAGEGKQQVRGELISELHLKVSKYAATKFFVSLSTGLLVWLVLVSFRVDLAFLFALLAFVFNFIPSIGSILATLIPLPVVVMQFGFGPKFLAVLVFTGLIQFILGNVIEPKLMGESMDLHPITILLFLMFWGLVWGVPGMFLAVPITAIIKIIFQRFDSTRPLAELLAGRLPV